MSIWGFDYIFTNYDFRATLDLSFNQTLNYQQTPCQRGDIQVVVFLKQRKTQKHRKPNRRLF